MSNSDLRHRLTAILAADGVGYSRLMAADDGATVAALDAARAVFRCQIEANQGRVVDMAGDSVLAVFETATGAVSAALAVQNELQATTEAMPEDRRMRFRIGLHLGDVIEKPDGTVYGDGVNIAARLEGLAEPGGITVSDSVRIAVKGKVGASFEDRGEQGVKNIADPVRVYRVCPVGAAVNMPPPSIGPPTGADEIDLSLPDKPSIAVLSFTNMSGDPEQDYFTDGITEDIITELSRFKSLFVIARNSSFSYKGQSPDIRKVGKELGVRYVLEGSIRRSANRIRVTAQLIDAPTGQHIWAERYDRVLEDIFAVQEEVTGAIVMVIAPQIESAEGVRAARRRPDNLSAYEIAARAWAHATGGASHSDGGEAVLAIGEAKRALAIDPDSSLALMALSWAQAMCLFLQLAPDPAAALQEMTWAAERAVSLDRANATALALMAGTVIVSRQYDLYPQALADARGAHEINPNDVFVLLMLIMVEANSGQPEHATEHGLQLLRLSPRDSRRYMIYNHLSTAATAARRYDDGIRWAQLAMHDLPNLPQAHLTVAVCSVGAGRIDDAKAAFATLQQIAPLFAQSRLDGGSTQGRPKDRKRVQVFARIAAGLEDPSAADALR